MRISEERGEWLRSSHSAICPCSERSRQINRVCAAMGDPIGTPHCSARVIQYSTVCRHLTDRRRKHPTPQSPDFETTVRRCSRCLCPSTGRRVVGGSSRRRGRGRVGMGQRSDRRQRALVVVFRFQESDQLQGNAAAPTTRPIGIHLHSQPQLVGERPDPR